MIETLLVAILGTAIGGMLARESSALLCQLNRALLKRGLSRLPPAADDQRRGRIEADFEAYSERPVAGFLFALRLCLTVPGRLPSSLLAGGRLGMLRPSSVTLSGGLVGAMVVLEMERRRGEGDLNGSYSPD